MREMPEIPLFPHVGSAVVHVLVHLLRCICALRGIPPGMGTMNLAPVPVLILKLGFLGERLFGLKFEFGLRQEP